MVVKKSTGNTAKVVMPCDHKSRISHFHIRKGHMAGAMEAKSRAFPGCVQAVRAADSCSP